MQPDFYGKIYGKSKPFYAIFIRGQNKKPKSNHRWFNLGCFWWAEVILVDKPPKRHSAKMPPPLPFLNCSATLARPTVTAFLQNTYTHKKDTPFGMSFLWWAEVDSNHRSRRRQIYSLIHLAALESAHMKLCGVLWSR